MKISQNVHSFVFVLLACMPLALGCGGTGAPSAGNGGGSQAGGAGAGGDTSNPGGTTGAAGQTEISSTTVGPTAGSASGGSISKTGGSVSGGSVGSGGSVSSGGAPPIGGTTVKGGSGGAGGAPPIGGTTVKGGSGGAGGTPPIGGTTVTGGAGGGGGGGVTQITPIGDRVRIIMPLDRGWLLNKADASGAEGATFPDSTWTKVNLPHDWAVEGPFDSGAATTGRGGYAPSGIGCEPSCRSTGTGCSTKAMRAWRMGRLSRIPRGVR